MSATLSTDQEGIAAMALVESQLPLLAGCLSKHGIVADLYFEGKPLRVHSSVHVDSRNRMDGPSVHGPATYMSLRKPRTVE